MQDKFTTLTATAVPIIIENIDSEQIIRARFLKATDKTGVGSRLFYDWRSEPNGQLKKDFVLNQNSYKGEILIAGKNFGCGSSREHAAWAIRGAGFRAVVSSYFADIFRNNALNNALLPVQVSEKFLKTLFSALIHKPRLYITIDLPGQTIRFAAEEEKFDIDPYKKECLIKGFDDIVYLWNLKEKINAFEEQRFKN